MKRKETEWKKMSARKMEDVEYLSQGSFESIVDMNVQKWELSVW